MSYAIGIVRSLYFLPMQATNMAFAKLNKMLHRFGMSDAKTRIGFERIINNAKNMWAGDLLMLDGGDADKHLIAPEIACCGRTDEQRKYYLDRALELCGDNWEALINIAENLSFRDNEPAQALKVYDLVLDKVDPLQARSLTPLIESLCRAGRKREDKLLFLNKATDLLSSIIEDDLLLVKLARALLLCGETERARPLMDRARKLSDIDKKLRGVEDGINVLSQAEAMLFVSDNLGALPVKDVVEQAFKKLDSVDFGGKIAISTTMNGADFLFLVEEVKEVACAWLIAHLIGCGLKKEFIIPRIVELIKRNVEDRESDSLKEEGRYMPTIEILRILKDAGVSQGYINQEMMKLIFFMQERCTIEDDIHENAFALRGMRIVTEAAFDLMEYEFNDIDQALVAFLKQEVPGFSPEAYSELSIADAPLIYCLRFLPNGTRMKVLRHEEKQMLLIALSNLGVNEISSKVPNLISAMVDDLVSTRDRSGRLDYSELNGFVEALNKSITLLSGDKESPLESKDVSYKFRDSEAFMIKVRNLIKSKYPSKDLVSSGIANNLFFEFASLWVRDSRMIEIYFRMIESGVVPNDILFNSAQFGPDKFFGFVSRVRGAWRADRDTMISPKWKGYEFFENFVSWHGFEFIEGYAVPRKSLDEKEAAIYVDILSCGFTPDDFLLEAAMLDREGVITSLKRLSEFVDPDEFWNEEYIKFIRRKLELKNMFLKNFASFFRVENEADLTALMDALGDLFHLGPIIAPATIGSPKNAEELKANLITSLKALDLPEQAGMKNSIINSICLVLGHVSLSFLKGSGIMDVISPMIRQAFPLLPKDVVGNNEVSILRAEISLLKDKEKIEKDPNVNYIFELLKEFGSIEAFYRARKGKALDMLKDAGFNVEHLLSGKELLRRSRINGIDDRGGAPFAERLKGLAKSLLGGVGAQPSEIFSFNKTPSDRGKMFGALNEGEKYRAAMSGDMVAAREILGLFLGIVRDAGVKEKDGERRRKLEEYDDLFSGLLGEARGGRKVNAGVIRTVRSRKLVPEIFFDNERLSCCIFKPGGAEHNEISRIVLDPRTPLIEVWVEGLDEFVAVATEYLGKNRDGQPVVLMDSFESNNILFSSLGRSFSLKAVLDSLVYDSLLLGAREVVIHKIRYGKPLEFVNFVVDLMGKKEYEGVIRYEPEYYFEAVDPEDDSLIDSKTGGHHYTDAFKKESMKAEMMKGNVKSIVVNVGAYIEKFFKDGKPA